MCHSSCISFGLKNINKEEVIGKRILEIGSYDVNGSLRPIVENFNPSEYIGVDIKRGPGVDSIMTAETIVDKFGKNIFDMVIATELLEHVKEWQKVISDIKNVCRPDGIILVTTRSFGFPYHPFPEDYWRYEPEDMRRIFSDCETIKIEKDRQAPGIFVKFKKPKGFLENDLSKYELYNIIFDKRINSMPDEIKNFQCLSFSIKNFLRQKIIKLGKLILKKLE